MYKQRYRARNGERKERWVESWRADGRRRYATAPTRGALRAKLEHLKSEARTAVKNTGADEPLGLYMDRWLESMRHSVRPQTLLAYRQHQRLYIRPALGAIRLGQLKASDVNGMLNAMADRGLAPSTQNQSRAMLRKALEQAVTDKVLLWNAAASSRAPKRRATEMKTWSAEECRRFLVAAWDDPLRLVWILAMTRGLRIGELLGLQWKRVNLAAKTLKVDVSLHKFKGSGLKLMGTKTARANRTLSLPTVCVEAFEDHASRQRLERMAAGRRWTDHDLVFTNKWGAPLWPGEVRRRFYRLRTTAGLEHIRFHDLRHTCATLLLEQGTSPRVVQELLGHANIAITLGIYSHVRPELERAESERLAESILVDKSPAANTAADPE